MSLCATLDEQLWKVARGLHWPQWNQFWRYGMEMFSALLATLRGKNIGYVCTPLTIPTSSDAMFVSLYKVLHKRDELPIISDTMTPMCRRCNLV